MVRISAENLFKVTCLLYFLNFQSIIAQTTLCNDNDCGDVFATYSPVGSNVFCEGATVILQNKSTTKDFEVFYIDWGDGKKDTVRDYSDIKHVYTYSLPFKRCQSSAKFNQIISYIGEKRCGTKKSCNTATAVVSVKLNPEANIVLEDELCVSKNFQFKENGCHGDTFLWEFGDGKTSTERNPSHSYATTGYFNVKLTAFNECGMNTTEKTIRVVDFPKAGFAVEPSKGLCGNGIIQLKMNEDPWGKGSWEIEPKDTFSWKFLDTTYTFFSKDLKIITRKNGIFTITHTSKNICGIDKKQIAYKVYTPPSFQIDTPDVFCESGNITEKDLKFSYQGEIKSITWAFEGADRNADSSGNFRPVTFNKSGSVTMKIKTEVCDNPEHRIPITVIPKPVIDISMNPDKFCVGGDTMQLKMSPTGGKWRGLGISDPFSGKFFPKDAPENSMIQLIYEVNAGKCSASDTLNISIIPSQAVSLITDSFCIGDAPRMLRGSPLGGIYSGKGINAINGLFSPALSGNGKFPISYTYNGQNGCQITVTGIVRVDNPPVISLKDSLIFCESLQPSNLALETEIKVDSINGRFTWSGPGVTNTTGSLLSSLLPENEVSRLYVQYDRYGCTVSDSIFIKKEANNILTLSNDTTLCVNETSFSLKTNLPGGIWKGIGVDRNNGIINLSLPKVGQHTYQYIFRPETSCFQEGQVNLNILNPGLTISAGKDIEVCPDAEDILLEGGFPLGGTWSGIGLKQGNQSYVDIKLLKTGENIFTYCIREPSINACQACASRKIILKEAPLVSFTLPDNICADSPLQLKNTSSNADNFTWTTSENMQSQLKNPSFTFSAKGTQWIKLEAKNNKFCKASLEKTIFVKTPAKINISLSEKEACAPYDLIILKEVSGDDLNIQWINGKDTISGTEPPVWKLPGSNKDTIYKIEAHVKNTCAAAKSISEILIHPRPKAKFGIFPSEGCAPLTIQLSNVSEGGPLTYHWDFGNGKMAIDSMAEKQIYGLDDTDYKEYTVILRTENACGKDSLAKKISVYKRDTKAFFEVDSLQGCPPFQLRATSFSSAGSTLQWQLRSPEGAITSGNQPIFSSLLTVPGEYQLKLGATKCGTDTFNTTVKIFPTPEIAFNLKDHYCLGDTIKNILFASEPGQISGINWHFGDGVVSKLLKPEHLYKQSGTFNINLSAQSAIYACKTSLNKTVIIHPLPDVSLFPDKLAGCPPLSVNIRSKEEPKTSYVWHIENEIIKQNTNLSYVFNKSGRTKVYLSAGNQYGCTAESDTLQINTYPKPIASFSLPTYAYCEFSTLDDLKNNSIGATNTQWTWLNTTYNDLEPILTASQSKGEYDLQLLVKNSYECIDSIKKAIRIHTQSYADFDVQTSNVCVGNAPIFQNKSKNANQYQWFLGTIEVSKEFNPSFKTSYTGDYSITLITKNDNKCPDTLTKSKSITIYPNPKADFDYRTDFIRNTIGEVQFINKSLNANRYYWDFGDGQWNQTLGPLHEYDINRNIQVKLIAYADYANGFLCSDTIIKEIAPEWITTFYAPNALAPESGNAAVQLFKPVGIGLKAYEIQIISPWGERVWFSNKLNMDSPSEGWNGRKNNQGDLLPQGAYIWQAKITFLNEKNETYTGSVNLLR
jgi:PKD repeat protein